MAISGDSRVDLYALGIMLWELLAGRRFLQGDPAEHLTAVAKNERAPQAIAALVGAPLEIDAIIARLVAHDAGERYQSARFAWAELVKLLAKAPALPNGERGVRARIGELMYRLYPSEPSKSRHEFSSLVKAARWNGSEAAETEDGAANVLAPRTAGPSAPQASATALESDDPEFLPGTRYRIRGTMGRGGMGVVYDAEHVELQRRVALKVLSAEHATSAEYTASFRREARAIARVHHPNLVTIHDFGQASDGRLYCAMELVAGETLEQRLAREQLMDWPEAVRLGILACRGLEAAHGAGVVHRDLKPANLFLVRENEADEAGLESKEGLKLLDFGIAKTAFESLDSGKADDPGATDRLDRVGEYRITGTPEYMAPEQVGAGVVDARADIYALGCVLYEACTGRRPFVSASRIEMLEQKSKFAPESMRSRAGALGLPWRSIARCRKRSPRIPQTASRRPPSSAARCKRCSRGRCDGAPFRGWPGT